MHRYHALEPTFRLKTTRQLPAKSSELEAKIDAIWITEKRRRGRMLHNGTVYSVVNIEPATLTIYQTDYRHLTAQRVAPDIAATLGIRPLGVTGLLTCRDGFVLGKRADDLAIEAGLWEPAPAGGLDRPDPIAQLFSELDEELGLGPESVSPPRVIGLIEDQDSGVFDILFRVDTELTGNELQQRHLAARGGHEYSELAVVTTAELASFLAAKSAELLPALRAMLRAGGFTAV